MSTPVRNILIVENNLRNLELMSQFIAKLGYNPVAADSLEAIDNALDRKEPLDMALVDVTGFDKDIWIRCSRLHEQNIAFLVISPKFNVTIEKEGIKRRASGVLVKPLIMRELASLMKGILSE